MSTIPAGYPARLDLESPLDVARWRPLVNWLLAIPQLLIVNALQGLRGVLQLISFFTVLFTRRIPRPLFDAIAMTLRYEWRVWSYVLWMREGYPPFSFNPGGLDDGIDPASASVDPPEQLNRWLPLVKWFLAIPHFVVLVFLYIGAFFVALAAFVAVLITGRYPESLRSYLVSVPRWTLRVQAYVGFLTDRYPPFSLA